MLTSDERYHRGIAEMGKAKARAAAREGGDPRRGQGAGNLTLVMTDESQALLARDGQRQGGRAAPQDALGGRLG